MVIGATNHISNSLSYFTAYKHIPPIKVSLPNGILVSATIYGTIHLSPNFVLTDVLFLPCFKFNLISVTKLTQTLLCKLTFLEDICLIQDFNACKMIGTTKAERGLYILTQAVESSQSSAICNELSNFVSENFSCSFSSSLPNLWHYRLGHSSFDRGQTISEMFPFI